MKKIFIRFLGIVTVIMSCLIMAGCSNGSAIDTTLIVSDDFSGTRLMKVTMDEKVFADYFSGTMNDLITLVSTKCPDELAYTLPTDGNNTFTFELTFNSIDDYVSKLQKIYPEAEVNVEMPENVWGSGIRFNENFISANLLRWLQDSIVEAGYVSNDYAGYIFVDNSAVLQMGDMVFKSDGRGINVDTLVSVRLYEVNVLTDVKDDNTFDRAYVFNVVLDTIGNRQKDIKSFFEEKAGSTAKITEISDGGYEKYSVIATGLTSADIEKLDKALFTEASFAGKSTEGKAYFTSSNLYEESLSLDDYAYTGWPIHVNSYVRVPGSFVLKDSNGYERDGSGTTYDLMPDYVFVSSDDGDKGDPAETNFIIEKPYTLSSVDITTTRLSRNQFRKDVVFAMSGSISQEDKTKILANLEAGFKDVEGVEIDLKLKEEKKAPIKYCLSVTGAPEALGEAFTTFTGASASFYYGERYSPLLPAYKVVFEEWCDLDRIYGACSDDFNETYCVDMGYGATIDSVNHSLAVIKGRKATITSSQFHSIEVTAHVANLWAIASYLLALAAVVMIIAAFVVADKRSKMTPEMIAAANEKKAARASVKAAEKARRDAEKAAKKQERAAKKAKKDAAKKAMPKNDVIYRPKDLPHSGERKSEVKEESADIKAGETKESLENNDSQTCPDCGALIKPGAKFCTSCGKKLE